jgi:mRNA-degrading endonuclease toxin of MazEF toxin-antitoxin module
MSAYIKDYDSWNKEKKQLNNLRFETIPFHEREIWWCSVGVNLGDEQDGKNELFERPVLVVRKFNNRIAWVLPMSSKAKYGPYYHDIDYRGKRFSVLLSQLRIVSIKRFRRFIRKISPYQFSLINGKIVELLIKK